MALATTLLAGAKLYFYIPGSTTARATYTDSALTIPHAHPVVADSGGQFPAIYLDPTLEYKCELKTSGGELLESIENANTQTDYQLFSLPWQVAVSSRVANIAGGISLSRGLIGETLIPRTDAEVAAGVTPSDFGYPPGHILRYISQTEHASILAGTSTYDASAEVQNCIDALAEGDTMTIVGIVRAQGLLLKTSDIKFAGGGWICPVSNDVPATILTIADDSDDTLVRRLRGDIKIGDTSTNYTDWTNITGVKFVRCVEFDLGIDVTACAVGMSFAPTESAVAYNTFRLGMVYNNQVGIDFAPSGSGYANENTFLKGRFSHGSSLSGVGIVGVRATTQGGSGGAPENNVFYSPTFEMGGKAIYFNGGDMCRFVKARFEPFTTGTSGVDYESILIDIGANSSRCTFETSMCPEIFSGGREINHGSGTRTSDLAFTIATDLRGFFYPGAVVKLTVSGTTYFLTVRSSSFGGGNTTITVNNPLITASPTNVTTARISNLGVGSTIRIDRADDPSTSLAMTISNLANRIVTLERSMVVMQALDADRPALTFVRGTADANRAFRTMASTGETAYLQCTGHMRVTGFGLSATPATQQSANADTSGATLAQLEAEVNELKAVLRTFGFIAP